MSEGRPPALIRATHHYAFRSGEWAELVGTMVDPETGRACYAVKFEDGAADWWPVDDPAAGYEFEGEALSATVREFADEFDAYLAEQQESPAFRAAYRAAVLQQIRACPRGLAVDGREYRRRSVARRRRGR